MKEIKTTEAVGTILCQDITQIIKDVFKGPLFRKGHVVTEEDIPLLLSVGKDTLFVWDNDMEGMLHENEAAMILCRICGGDLVHMRRGEISEGKIELFSEMDGLLKIHREGLKAVNSFGQMMIATRHGDTVVRKGDKLAGTRIIPLAIEREKMEDVQRRVQEVTGGHPLISVLPFVKKKVGIITTGNEVFYGRIEDTFTPVIEEKLSEYDIKITEHVIVNDDHERITSAILEMVGRGVDLVICTGGMSVDPDDKTPLAIKNTGARIVSYGAPVLPGAMFLLAYLDDKIEKGNRLANTAIVGLPGCVMYARRTIFDLVLPRLMCDDPITADDLSALGEGGLCLNCKTCTFPNCGYGKGH